MQGPPFSSPEPVVSWSAEPLARYKLSRVALRTRMKDPLSFVLSSDLGVLFIYMRKNRKIRFENQMIRATSYGKLQETWAVI